MTDWTVSPLEIKVAQIMVGIATAVFIGVRFLPSHLRQPVGITLTVCYLVGITAFVLYMMLG